MKIVLVTLLFAVLFSVKGINADSYEDVMLIINILRCADITDRVIQKAGHEVFQYNIQGSGRTTSFYLDFKNTPAEIELGTYPVNSPDVTFGINDTDFIALMRKELPPFWAFVSGRITVLGSLLSAKNLERALMELEKGIDDYSGSCDEDEDEYK